MKNNLDFALTVREMCVAGLKNLPAVIAAVVLWALTFWIPYLNVGTTIGLAMLPLSMTDGKKVNPLSIFDSRWRRCMGEYLLLGVLLLCGVLAAMFFLFVPGIVVALSWSLAGFYLCDRGKNPMQALHASGEATYGSKWMIFLVTLLLQFVYFLFYTAAVQCWLRTEFVALVIVLGVLLLAVFVSFQYAASASVWRQLRDNAE